MNKLNNVIACPLYHIYTSSISTYLKYVFTTFVLNTAYFENRVLRRIFGLKRDEAMGGSRKLQNEELHNLYPSPSIIKMI
jgi:hypothetical protein